MSGRNTIKVPYPKDLVLTDGYVIVRHNSNGNKELVFRPDRGSGGFPLWSTEVRAEAECDETETVSRVRLLVEEVWSSD